MTRYPCISAQRITLEDVAGLADHDRAAGAPLRIEDERSGEQDRQGRMATEDL